MNKKILHIIWLLLFALPILLFSQKSEENIKHLVEVVNNINKHGKEKIFYIIKPLVKSPKNKHERLQSLYIMRLYYSNKETADSILYFGHKIMDLTESRSDSLSLNMLNKAYVLLDSGFDSEKMPEGIGLSNIKSRLKRINGDFNIDSKPRRGTIVNIEIPITITQNET